MSKRKATKVKKAIAPKPVPVPPLHEDQVKAKELRDRLAVPLKEVCLILDESVACGFLVSFDLKPSMGSGNMLINGIHINRKL